MELTFFHKNLTKKEIKLFEDYINQKADAISTLLSKFSPDNKILKVAIEKFDKHDAYQVELCLNLPAKTLKSMEASHNITKAVDLSKDRLISQIKKHIAHLRNDRAHKSIRKTEIKVEENADILL